LFEASCFKVNDGDSAICMSGQDYHVALCCCTNVHPRDLFIPRNASWICFLCQCTQKEEQSPCVWLKT